MNGPQAGKRRYCVNGIIILFCPKLKSSHHEPIGRQTPLWLNHPPKQHSMNGRNDLKYIRALALSLAVVLTLRYCPSGYGWRLLVNWLILLSIMLNQCPINGDESGPSKNNGNEKGVQNVGDISIKRTMECLLFMYFQNMCLLPLSFSLILLQLFSEPQISNCFITPAPFDFWSKRLPRYPGAKYEPSIELSARRQKGRYGVNKEEVKRSIWRSVIDRTIFYLVHIWRGFSGEKISLLQ